MNRFRHNLTLLSVFAAAVLVAHADEKPAPKLPEETKPSAKPAGSVVDQLKRGTPSEDLTIGRLPNDSIEFKEHTAYLKQQDELSRKKLEQIPALRGATNQSTTNRWIEVDRIVREVLNSDATRDVKLDAKRLALVELALLAERDQKYEIAQQLLAEYIERFPLDVVVPEILLRQGLLFRKMGQRAMAISKYYSVMTASIRLRGDNLARYERIVITAQAEIADTHLEDGDFKEAANLYERLLKNRNEEMSEMILRLKLIRAHAAAAAQISAQIEPAITLAVKPDATPTQKSAPDDLRKELTEVNMATIDQCNEFLRKPQGAEHDVQFEVRHHLAKASHGAGRQEDALHQFKIVQDTFAAGDAAQQARWSLWLFRSMNEFANQSFQAADFAAAADAYRWLLARDRTIESQVQILNQIGLCHERLREEDKAVRAYTDLITAAQDRPEEIGKSTQRLALQTIVGMARVRNEILSFKRSVEESGLNKRPEKEN
ncbi:MAG: tetratricopeptide repeat protein [Pedosphaera sp.]|nr:tetratricopeptide repeat protein [Pedosphaera sp.]MSS99801.1 tetratricopeptide repeat protein [Pedosphaera sp.]